MRAYYHFLLKSGIFHHCKPYPLRVGGKTLVLKSYFASAWLSMRSLFIALDALALLVLDGCKCHQHEK